MSTVERLDEAVRLTALSAYGVRFPDLIVRYGEVVVLAGPNGSGKSTVSRVLVGELAAAGAVSVMGTDPFTAELKSRIGFLVKDLETMGSLTSRDVLDICAAVRGCGTSYAHELAARLGLDLDRPMADLSRGQLRRLGIIQALMHEPELIVLDDPMTELDDEAREVLPALLQDAAARGAAVVMTAQSELDAGACGDRVVPLRRHDDDKQTEQEPDLATADASLVRGSELCDAERATEVERSRVHGRPRQAVRCSGADELEGAAHPGHGAGRGDGAGRARGSVLTVVSDPTGDCQLPRAGGGAPGRATGHRLVAAGAGQARAG